MVTIIAIDTLDNGTAEVVEGTGGATGVCRT